MTPSGGYELGMELGAAEGVGDNEKLKTKGTREPRVSCESFRVL